MSDNRDARAWPKRSPKILWREVDGCTILFHEDTGRAFALNETASQVWKMCDGNVPVHDMSSRLGGPGEEVEGFVEELIENECVEMAGTSTGEPASPSTPAPSPDGWLVPSVEEIVFAACDCSGGGRGVVRNAQCLDIPKQQASTI